MVDLNFLPDNLDELNCPECGGEMFYRRTLKARVNCRNDDAEPEEGVWECEECGYTEW